MITGGAGVGVCDGVVVGVAGVACVDGVVIVIVWCC